MAHQLLRVSGRFACGTAHQAPAPERSSARLQGIFCGGIRGEHDLLHAVDGDPAFELAAGAALLVDLAETGTVPIYGINHRDPPEAALAFLRELGDPYNRIGADRNGRVSIDWGVYGLPETFVIDGDGRIAYKHVGPFDRRALEEEILPVVRRLQAEDGS